MLLEVRNLEAFYGDLQALFDVTVSVDEGECVAMVGANGAGKTTFLKCIAGLLDQRRGSIVFCGKDVTQTRAEKIATLGLALAPEGRMLFPSLSVEENLLMGTLVRRNGYWNLRRLYDNFPILEERRNQAPNTLSGGQQGFVAIGRALMANPSLLLCDELSLGLAPVAVDQIYAALDAVRATGTSVLIVEQDVKRAMLATDRLYCLLEGRVTLQSASNAVTTDELARAYFGN